MIRPYVKWDDQPGSIEGVPDSFARAYGAMMTQPQGPIYMCYDAALQETPLTEDVAMPPVAAAKAPAPMMPAPDALRAIADKLLASDSPLLMAEYVGRRQGGFESMVELAETIGAPFLGEVPLDIVIRQTSDGGAPVVASAPESTQAQAFVAIAEQVRAQLFDGAKPERAAPRIFMS